VLPLAATARGRVKAEVRAARRNTIGRWRQHFDEARSRKLPVLLDDLGAHRLAGNAARDEDRLPAGVAQGVAAVGHRFEAQRDRGWADWE
jgi:hypothetical protein